MNTKSAKQLAPGTQVYISGLSRESIPVTFVKFEEGLVTVNTINTPLDFRRSQINIDAGVHQLSVFPKYVTLEETEPIQPKKTSFDRPIGGYRKF